MSNAAAKAVARHLRGLNMHGADPDVAALEILQLLRGHGWRPTPAQPAPTWQPPTRPMTPEAVHAAAAQVRQELTRSDP